MKKLLILLFIISVVDCEIGNAKLFFNKISTKKNIGICVGDSALIKSDFKGINYLWYHNNSLYSNEDSFYVKDTGIYHSVVVDSLGSYNYDTAIISYKVPANSDWTVVNGYGNYIEVNASGGPGHTFYWDFGDPNSNSNNTQLPNPTHYFSTPGGHLITLKTQYVISGCESTTSRYVILESGHQSTDINHFVNFNINPNPITIESSVNYTLTKECRTSLEVYDLLGRKIKIYHSNLIQPPSEYKYCLNDLLSLNMKILIIKFDINGASIFEKIYID